MKTITVAELLELLEGQDTDAKVIFSTDYGDHCHTPQALPLKGEAETVTSNGHVSGDPMKELPLEWQIAAHNLLVKLASAENTLAVLMLKEEAKQLLRLAEREYEEQS